MSLAIGLDIGGTKIAGAMFNANGLEIAQATAPTPPTYKAFLETCRFIVDQLEQQGGPAVTIGACAPYADAHVSANIECLIGQNPRRDLEHIFGKQIPFANDANCAALAEAVSGAGAGYRSVFGLILGTGVGGGFILDGRIVAGANGVAGEIGHMPLPYYEEADGTRTQCNCGQTGCIERLAAGPALARLYHSMTGKNADARQIGELARAGDSGALATLDRYYTIIAKAMISVLHMFDPDIITVSGGLNALPGLYDAVPKRWGRYAIVKNPVTRFVPAAYGAMAGLRGAAWLGQSLSQS